MDKQMSALEPTDQNRLLLFNRDLMAGIAITNAAKAHGLQVTRISTESDLAHQLDQDAATIALVVLDMNAAIDWDIVATLIEEGDDLPPIIGFGPHVDVEGRRSAKSAGLTRIYSNGDFHRSMGEIIARHAGTDPRR